MIDTYAEDGTEVQEDEVSSVVVRKKERSILSLEELIEIEQERADRVAREVGKRWGTEVGGSKSTQPLDEAEASVLFIGTEAFLCI